MANECADIGSVYAALAASETTPFGKKQENWRVARSWYERSLNLLLKLRAGGALRAIDAAKFDEVTGELAHCDAELNKRKVVN